MNELGFYDFLYTEGFVLYKDVSTIKRCRILVPCCAATAKLCLDYITFQASISTIINFRVTTRDYAKVPRYYRLL